MLINRVRPMTYGLTRHHCFVLLGALDLGLMGITTVAVLHETRPLLAALWLMAALAAWMLTRGGRQKVAMDSYVRAVLTPVLTVGALLGFALALREDMPLSFLAAMAIWWGLGMGLSRLLLRRRMPPMIFGVIGTNAALPEHPRVSYQCLDPRDMGPMSHLDGLLIGPAAYSPEWFALLEHAQAAGMPIWTAAQLLEETHGKVSLEALHQDRLRAGDHHTDYLPLKRVLDLGVTLLAVPLLLPLLLAVTVIVLLDAGWPVLFFQQRVGQHGRAFRIAKFRTMRRDSELLGATFASTGDARVTRLGRWLRKFRLDELPQFWNVLRGDMSVIGPRPEQQQFVQTFQQDLYLYDLRHWVKPGITGWAQVTQGYAAGADETLEKLRYDVYYIKHVSFWLDARIVMRTLLTILTGFGAR